MAKLLRFLILGSQRVEGCIGVAGFCPITKTGNKIIEINFESFK